MISLVFTLAVTCPVIEIKNWTNTWDKYDILNMESARLGCKRLYSPNHCLSVFIKEDTLTYVALCKKVGK